MNVINQPRCLYDVSKLIINMLCYLSWKDNYLKTTLEIEQIGFRIKLKNSKKDFTRPQQL